jgi:predicted TIM-barrel fold metal-dependent hydrolase
MPDRKVIDVHCHLFNAQYAIMELAAATWNNLWGDYPHQKAGIKERRARGIVETLDGVKEFAAWIARLVEAALSDCDGNYDTAREKFSQSALGQGCSLTLSPLMMDIYFALDNNEDEEEARSSRRRSVPVIEAFGIPEDKKMDFDSHFDEIKNLIIAEIQTAPKTGRRSSDQALDTIFQDAKKDMLESARATRRGDKDPYEGIELSPGYKKHMHDLEELCIKYPGEVFPFLAIDPRRIGIMKLIDMKVDEGNGPFRGIKLYPPLGYLPTHPNLAEVFEYCNAHDIPITFHCSPGGIKNFRDENYVRSWEGNDHLENFQSTSGNKSEFYTAPQKWAPVLERWKNLRINFAHMGGGDQLDSGATAWMQDILSMIERYPNMYTDMSYHTKQGLAQKLADLVRQHRVLNSRLMFGTDFIMIMLDKDLGGLDKYFDRFTEFNNNLLYENAKSFLKL